MPVETRHSTRGSMTWRSASAPAPNFRDRAVERIAPPLTHPLASAGCASPPKRYPAPLAATQGSISTTPPSASGARASARAQAREAERRCPASQTSPAGGAGPSHPRSPGPSPFTLWSVIPEMGAQRAGHGHRQQGRREGGEAMEGRDEAAEDAEGHERHLRLSGRARLSEGADLLVVGEICLQEQVGEGVS